MEANDDLQKIKCPNCGFLDTGNYCSKCGSLLTEKPRSAYFQFLDTFLKIGEIKKYIQTYFKILSSPTRNTISIYEEGTSTSAFQFLAYSFAIYIFTAFSRVIIIREHGLIVGIITTLQFLITLSISIPLFYKMCIRKSSVNKTFRDFLIFSSLYVGFNLPIVGVLQLLQFIHPLFSILILIPMIPILIYVIRVLKYFWQLSGGRLFFSALISSFIGAFCGILFLIICSTIFQINLVGS